MYPRAKRFVLMALLSVLLVVQSGCISENSKSETVCPFSSLTFESKVEDMVFTEGESYETYDSIYKGTTYTYPKDYLGYPGDVKYMFDGEGNLCNISWAYTKGDADSVKEVYEAVLKDTESIRGEGIKDDGIGNYCTMWKGDAGSVVLSGVLTSDVTVMQIAYMSPDVSKQTK